MVKKKVLPPTYLVLSIVVMVAVNFLIPVTKVIAFPWNLLGLIPLVLGVIINLLADATFKKHETTVKPFEYSTALVTIGIYRVSRHPMYLGMVFILVGIAVLMGSLSPFLIIVIFAVLMDVVFIRIEEVMIEKEFGDTWFKYKEAVRRWI